MKQHYYRYFHCTVALIKSHLIKPFFSCGFHSFNAVKFTGISNGVINTVSLLIEIYVNADIDSNLQPAKRHGLVVSNLLLRALSELCISIIPLKSSKQLTKFKYL